MHILHLAKWYPNHQNPQLGVFVRKQALAAAMHHFVVVVHVVEGKNGEISTVKNRDKFVEISASYNKHSRSMISKFLNLWNQYRAWKLGIRHAFDHFGPFDGVHAHILLRPAIWAYLLSKRYKIPFVISEHWAGYATGTLIQKPYFWKLPARFVSRKASQILTVSEFLRKHMLNQQLKGNYRVVPNVVDIPDQLPDKPEILTQGINIVVVSDLVDQIKNISGVLDAFIQVCEQKDNLYLHIGGGGNDAEKLKKQADISGLLNKRIFFHGLLTNPEANRLISQASFVVVNSRVETFSVVTGEALLHGKPVIATRCGGPEEILESHCGELIDIDNRQQLTKAMLNMAENFMKYNPDILTNSVKDRFSSHSVGLQLDEVYRTWFNPELCNRSRSEN